MGFIYRLTSPVGKSYIGQTIQSIEKRLKDHQKPDSKCVAIYNAIQHHGWEKMKKEYFEVPDEDLDFYEEMLIALLGTLAPGGYNLREGGGSGGKMCEEVKKKISIAVSGDKNHMYGRTHTDEAKQKLSVAMSGENNPNFGKTPTEETRAKMSESTKGDKHPFYGKPRTDETKKKISVAHLGKTHTDKTKKQISVTVSGENNPQSKKVYQYELSGMLVKSFASCGEAATHLNKGDGSSIGKCANGNRKTAYGFKWSFTEL
ncbi:GIY-YIG catalytic domain-containing endonuclease [Acanthocystis turfacea Chlorella virus Br0604L]|nr:GIY-YIG catalytic domain-containing endonuclease [Acanthocystis turfacea Chlorella virus Br0604L]